MQYWCNEYYDDGYDNSDCYNDGYDYGDGYGNGYSPAMLVTGVKLEEVVLNAVFV